MGKATGFLESARENSPVRETEERIRDWSEFHIQPEEQALQIQASRCMDCGVPFCHTGSLLKGQAVGCPIHNLIPEWNDLVYRGQWQEALGRLHKTNNFPEFTGRVCPAPCEGSCNLGLIDEPVAIKDIELAIVDRGFQEGWIRAQPPSQRTGKTVAVVGSGPAGLACADQLNKAGHSVTVFERFDRIGGLLMYGIPNMKLAKAVVDRRIALLEAEGITFVTKCEIGADYPVESLESDYDAAIFCCGAEQPRDLPIPGREASGIYFAMEYLRANTKTLLDSGSAQQAEISAAGKDVVIIGGGDTGTDCAATALRHGCRSVVQLEIMPQPPQERASSNPWPQWPHIMRSDYGQDEAAARFGSDPRQYLVMSKRFAADDGNRVSGIHAVQIEWAADAAGKRFPREVPGTERFFPAQLVLLAMGFTGPRESLSQTLDLTMSEKSFCTNRSSFFAAGDMRRGQSLVVWAIDEGRRAAEACHRYLQTSHS